MQASLIRRSLCVLAALSALAAGGPSDDANSKVAPAGANAYGASYGEWSARHWQWLFSFPAEAHPLADTAAPEAGQTGHVWFLGGTFSAIEIEPGVILGEADRVITVPSGTALFFPLVDAEASTLEGNGDTEAELRDFANFLADFADPSSLVLEIDGKPVTNLASLRAESPLSTYGPLPDNNVLEASGIDAPAGSTSPFVSDGYWAMVKPLPVGTHTLHFGGTIDLSSVGGPMFIQDIEYTVTVVPRGRG